MVAGFTQFDQVAEFPVIHNGLPQTNMHALRIQPFLISHAEERVQDIATDFRGVGMTGNTETISTAGNFNVEATFNLAQVLVELTAEVGESTVICGLQDDIPGYLRCVQVDVFTAVMADKAISPRLPRTDGTCIGAK